MSRGSISIAVNPRASVHIAAEVQPAAGDMLLATIPLATPSATELTTGRSVVVHHARDGRPVSEQYTVVSVKSAGADWHVSLQATRRALPKHLSTFHVDPRVME